jgi:hypothetical protein
LACKKPKQVDKFKKASIETGEEEAVVKICATGGEVGKEKVYPFHVILV